LESLFLGFTYVIFLCKIANEIKNREGKVGKVELYLTKFSSAFQ